MYRVHGFFGNVLWRTCGHCVRKSSGVGLFQPCAGLDEVSPLVFSLGSLGFVGKDFLAVLVWQLCAHLLPDYPEFLGEWVEDDSALVEVVVLFLAVFHGVLLIDDGR